MVIISADLVVLNTGVKNCLIGEGYLCLEGSQKVVGCIKARENDFPFHFGLNTEIRNLCSCVVTMIQIHIRLAAGR